MMKKLDTVKMSVKPASGNAIRQLSATEQRSVAGGHPWPPNYIPKQPTEPF